MFIFHNNLFNLIIDALMAVTNFFLVVSETSFDLQYYPLYLNLPLLFSTTQIIAIVDEA